MPSTPGMAPVFNNYFATSPYYGGGYPGSTQFSPYTSASEATSFNLGSGANTEALTGQINALNRQGQAAALGSRIPNATGLEAESSANIGSELAGNLPADVIRNLQQAAAERGVAVGSPGSPNSSAAYLRALGLSSLDLSNMGQQNLSSALARNPAAPLFDPSQLLITPYQGATLGATQTQLGLREQELRDQLIQDRANLARQSALGGPRGGGAAEDPGAYARQPFASDLQTTFVGASPTASPGPAGNLLFMNPAGANYAYPPTTGTGTYSATDAQGNPVAPAPGGSLNAGMDTEQMMNDLGFA